MATPLKHSELLQGSIASVVYSDRPIARGTNQLWSATALDRVAGAKGDPRWAQVACFGVFEDVLGEGVGRLAADFFVKKIPRVGLPDFLAQSLVDAASALDGLLRFKLHGQPDQGARQGAFGTVAAVTSQEIVVAGLGLGQALLVRRGRSPVSLARAQFPQHPTDELRIKGAGSEVRLCNDGGLRVDGIFPAARAWAYWAGKSRPDLPPYQQAVVAIPEVYEAPMDPDTDYLILATSEVRDFEQDAVALARLSAVVDQSRTAGGSATLAHLLRPLLRELMPRPKEGISNQYMMIIRFPLDVNTIPPIPPADSGVLSSTGDPTADTAPGSPDAWFPASEACHPLRPSQTASGPLCPVPLCVEPPAGYQQLRRRTPRPRESAPYGWPWARSIQDSRDSQFYHDLSCGIHPHWEPSAATPPEPLIAFGVLRPPLFTWVNRQGQGHALRHFWHPGTDTAITVWRTSLPDAELQELFSDMWHRPDYLWLGQEPNARSTLWQVVPPCKCSYSYGRNVTVPPGILQPGLCALPHLICSELPPGRFHLGSFDSMNVTRYRSTQDSLPWHSDNEDLFQARHAPAAILSLSVGAPMVFEIRRAGTEHAWFRHSLQHGEALLMSGSMQQHHHHRVIPAANTSSFPAARVNFTWRTIKQHIRSCPLRS